MVSKLNEIRRGTLGTVLFFGYAVALVITMYLVGFSLLQLHQQADALKHQQARSCGAIQGAALFWRGERSAVNLMLRDQTLPLSVTTGLGQLNLLLDNVLNEADSLPCPRKETPNG